MTTTLTKTKRRIAGAVLAATIAVPAIAAASHGFGDVPDSHTFHDDIDWIAEESITLGCGDGTNYCPEDPVTRGQMAAFLHRMSGEAPGFGRSVNAEKLDGLHATELTRIDSEFEEDNSIWTGSTIDLDDPFAVPMDGYVIVEFTATVAKSITETGSGSAQVLASVGVDGDFRPASRTTVNFDLPTTNFDAQVVSTQHVFNVSAGTRDIVGRLEAPGLDNAKRGYIYNRQMTVQFVPFAEIEIVIPPFPFPVGG